MKLIIPIFLIIIISSSLNAQLSMTMYGGVIQGYSPDKMFTPAGTGHSGFVSGVNVRLFDDGLCFLFSGEYGRYNLLANDKMSFFSGHGLSFSRGKGGIGFNIARLGKKSFLRSKFQGTAMYINKADYAQIGGTPQLRENGYVKLNEAIGGIATGLGITYGRLELDFEFERGFFNIYNTIKSTRMNFMSLTLGIRLGPASDTYQWAKPKAEPRA